MSYFDVRNGCTLMCRTYLDASYFYVWKGEQDGKVLELNVETVREKKIRNRLENVVWMAVLI